MEAPQHPFEPLPDGGSCGAAGPAQVLVVDDDAAVCAALERLLSLHGYEVSTFRSAESFLARHDPQAWGCVILDVAMPGLGGLALQQALEQRDSPLPIIFLSGAADVPICAQAMKRGAFDFLVKPVDETLLFAAVAQALLRHAALLHERAQKDLATTRLASLTARERAVIEHVAAGRLNKQIAADLGTAEKTVKVHRARGMEKMHVRSVADLVRVMQRAHRRPGDSA